MSLCRHYVRGLRSSALIPTPELEKSNSKRSSAVLEGMGETRNDSTAGPSTFERKITPDQRLSAFLRNDNGSKYSPSGSHASDRSNDNTPGSERPPRPSFMATPSNDNSPGAVSSGSPSSTVARVDIRASAEKILYTYLLQGSEREIILPVGILENITTAIEQEGRDDPEVFDAAKDYVFQAMERDAFPGFLRAKALGNIVQPSMMLRLIVGLVSLFGALWTAFVLIFLDYSRATRCWVSLSFYMRFCACSTLFRPAPLEREPENACRQTSFERRCDMKEGHVDPMVGGRRLQLCHSVADRPDSARFKRQANEIKGLTMKERWTGQ